MSACRLASMQFITQVSIKLLRKLVRAARFSEASKAPRNMPKHKSSSIPNCAAESTTIEDSSGPPFSKFAESSTRERVKSHHVSADGSDRCCFSVVSHWSSWIGAQTSRSHGLQLSGRACLFRALSYSDARHLGTHDDVVCPGKRVGSWINVCSFCRVTKGRDVGSGPVSRVWISRPTAYRWINYNETGPEGLLDRSRRRPHSCSHATLEPIENAILVIRASNWNRAGCWRYVLRT
jgi:Helix-turn-helix domain